MSSTADKLKGTANQAAGKIKKGVGEATDDPALKGEGNAQEAKGDLQKASVRPRIPSRRLPTSKSQAGNRSKGRRMAPFVLGVSDARTCSISNSAPAVDLCR
jgi:uncharacterized protein YjbJ (UPF0337 family)